MTDEWGMGGNGSTGERLGVEHERTGAGVFICLSVIQNARTSPGHIRRDHRLEPHANITALTGDCFLHCAQIRRRGGWDQRAREQPTIIRGDPISEAKDVRIHIRGMTQMLRSLHGDELMQATDFFFQKTDLTGEGGNGGWLGLILLGIEISALRARVVPNARRPSVPETPGLGTRIIGRSAFALVEPIRDRRRRGTKGWTRIAHPTRLPWQLGRLVSWRSSRLRLFVLRMPRRLALDLRE